MDDETIEDHFAMHDDVVETLLDQAALEVGDDTVVTSAAPPVDESPWPERRSQSIHAVSFTSGSTR